jgi:DeoR/GlpR family transcriptional regulator of sugar metabolism
MIYSRIWRTDINMHSTRKAENARERAYAIIEILLKRDYVTVSALAAQLTVSDATIRKDLTALEQQGLLRRTHGGVVHMRELTQEIMLFYENREVKNITEKRRIGQAAASRIQEGAVVAFSGGSTPLQIARQIPPGLAFTAITNDLSIVRTLSDHEKIEIFVPGGYLRLGRDNLVGPNAITALQDIEIDQAFLTVTALDPKLGATAGHISNVVYLRELVARTRQCIVVADHSKFQNPPQIVICGWERISILITDEGVSTATRQQIEARGVSVDVV